MTKKPSSKNVVSLFAALVIFLSSFGLTVGNSIVFSTLAGFEAKDFCKQFNERTQDQRGNIIPVVITVFEDRTFSFILKTPPASELIKKAIGIQKGSGKPLLEKVGKINQHQLREIAEKKMPDLNAHDLDAATRIIAGTARQMGVTIEE